MASFPGMLPGMLMNPAMMQQLRTLQPQIQQALMTAGAANMQGPISSYQPRQNVPPGYFDAIRGAAASMPNRPTAQLTGGGNGGGMDYSGTRAYAPADFSFANGNVPAATGRGGASSSGRGQSSPVAAPAVAPTAGNNYGYGASSPVDQNAFNAAATGPFAMAAQDRVGPDDTTQQRQQSNLANLMAAINPTARAQQYLTDFNGYQAAQQNMKRGIDPNNPGFDPREYAEKFLGNLSKTTDMGLMQQLSQAQARGMSPSLDLIKQLMPAASTQGTMYDSSLMKQSDFNGLRPQDAMQLMMQARQRQAGQLPSAPQMQTEAPQSMQMPPQMQMPQMQQMQRGFSQMNPNALQMMAMMRPQMSQMAQPRPRMAAPRFGNVSSNPYSMSMGMRSF